MLRPNITGMERRIDVNEVSTGSGSDRVASIFLKSIENECVKRASIVVMSVSEIVASLCKHIPVLEELLALRCIENIAQRFVAQAIEQPLSTTERIPFIENHLAEAVGRSMAFHQTFKNVRNHHFESGR